MTRGLRTTLVTLALGAIALGGAYFTGALDDRLKSLGLMTSIDEQRRARFADAEDVDWPDLSPPQDQASLPHLRNGDAPRGLIRHGELGATKWPAEADGESLPPVARTLGGYRDMYAPPRVLADSFGGIGNMRALQPPGGGLRAELDGRVVRIAGFIAPLAFNRGRLSEFLLVPYVGACIHVPPPPANQIVHVADLGDFRTDQGLLFPVSVTGRLRVVGRETDLAVAGYEIEGGLIERYE